MFHWQHINLPAHYESKLTSTSYLQLFWHHSKLSLSNSQLKQPPDSIIWIPSNLKMWDRLIYWNTPTENNMVPPWLWSGAIIEEGLHMFSSMPVGSTLKWYFMGLFNLVSTVFYISHTFSVTRSDGYPYKCKKPFNEQIMWQKNH